MLSFLFWEALLFSPPLLSRGGLKLRRSRSFFVVVVVVVSVFSRILPLLPFKEAAGGQRGGRGDSGLGTKGLVDMSVCCFLFIP